MLEKNMLGCKNFVQILSNTRLHKGSH